MSVISDLEKKTGKKLYVLSWGWEDKKEWEALSLITKTCSVNGGVTIDIEKLFPTPDLPSAESFSDKKFDMKGVVERGLHIVLEVLREEFKKMPEQLFLKLKEEFEEAMANEKWDCPNDESVLREYSPAILKESGRLWAKTIVQYGALTKEGWRRRVWGDPDPQLISLPPELGDSKICPNTIAFLGNENLNMREFVKRVKEITEQGNFVNLANSDIWWMDNGDYVPKEEGRFYYYLRTAKKLEKKGVKIL